MNTATIIGRAGQDAEIRYFESGKVKTTFSLAVNRWDSKTKSEIPDWFNVELWDKQAEIAGEYVKKGREVAVDGRISISKWTDQSGEERERYLIVANSLQLLGSKRDALTQD
jgi:single-strand DNA-binding protein